MQLSLAFIFSFIVSVVYSQTIAQEVGQLPLCSVGCLTTALTKSGCAVTDYACQCSTGRATIAPYMTTCIEAACSATDQQNVITVANTICEIALANSTDTANSTSNGTSTSTTTAASSSSTNASTGAGSKVETIGFMAAMGVLAAFLL